MYAKSRAKIIFLMFLLFRYTRQSYEFIPPGRLVHCAEIVHSKKEYKRIACSAYHYTASRIHPWPPSLTSSVPFLHPCLLLIFFSLSSFRSSDNTCTHINRAVTAWYIYEDVRRVFQLRPIYLQLWWNHLMECIILSRNEPTLNFQSLLGEISHHRWLSSSCFIPSVFEKTILQWLHYRVLFVKFHWLYTKERFCWNKI